MHGAAGLACAAVCWGDGGCCVPGAGRGVTLLAAWAVPVCAGAVRGEGRTEEFAIWASLLLSCCYGTAEMLPGRRWWPACVTPGLPRGREISILVLAGTELTLFLVAGTVLCFGFSVRMMLITR